MFLLFCAFFIFSVVNTEFTEFVDVEVKQGILRGGVSSTSDGALFYTFSGIPYAEPPVGNLRFKDPQEPKKWNDIRNATIEGSYCRSRHIVTNNFVGSEDCLYLNVYTPQLQFDVSEEINLPVMFWIHGGSFYMGSGSSYRFGPDWIVEQDVVLVTINYRLGALGFLSLDIPDAPGNAGLKDQVAALKWVKHNIKYFGGNPDDVTIFGESAGGSCVHYHILSETTKNLFHKAIAQSGTALNDWAYENNPRERAITLCKLLNHTFTDPETAINFLRTVPIETLVEQAERVVPLDYLQRMKDIVFGPTKEKIFPGQEPFLADHPLNIMKSGKFNKVPLMIGYTDAEGIMAMQRFVDDPKLFKEVEDHLDRFLLPGIKINPKEGAQKFKEFYFKNKSISMDTIDAFVDLVSDYLIIQETNKMARLHVNMSEEPVYFYRFAFDEKSFFKELYDINLTRACHGDELLYLFTNKISDFPNDQGSNVDITQQRMTHLWTNFAKTGNPTPEESAIVPIIWEKMTKEKMNYLNINYELETGINPDAERLEFWENLYKSGASINTVLSMASVLIICMAYFLF